MFELWYTDFSCNQAPVWGAVRYVNKRFKHDDFFHGENETSPELDAVWKNLTGREFSPPPLFPPFPEWLRRLELQPSKGYIASQGHVRLPLDEAKKNVPSLELHFDLGNYLYGVSVFHQMHCLVSKQSMPARRVPVPNGFLSTVGYSPKVVLSVCLRISCALTT